MTTPRIERHIAAVTELLRTATGKPVDSGVAPSDPPPYLVVHPDAGMVARDRLNGEARTLYLRFEVEAVATGPEQALWLLDTARTALLEVGALTVDGCKVSLLRQIDGSGMHRDEVAQPPIYMIDAEFQGISQTIG